MEDIVAKHITSLEPWRYNLKVSGMKDLKLFRNLDPFSFVIVTVPSVISISSVLSNNYPKY